MTGLSLFCWERPRTHGEITKYHVSHKNIPNHKRNRGSIKLTLIKILVKILWLFKTQQKPFVRELSEQTSAGRTNHPNKLMHNYTIIIHATVSKSKHLMWSLSCRVRKWISRVMMVTLVRIWPDFNNQLKAKQCVAQWNIEAMQLMGARLHRSAWSSATLLHFVFFLLHQCPDYILVYISCRPPPHCQTVGHQEISQLMQPCRVVQGTTDPALHYNNLHTRQI